MKTFIRNLRSHSQSGFSLVELMIVVAIIGILSAVAIPNFKKYQAKSKTSEAKLQLAALFTAQTSFFADYNTYASCLVAMGFDPSSEVSNRYYAVGFASAVTAAATAINLNARNQGATVCVDAVPHQFAAGRQSGTATAITTAQFTTEGGTIGATAYGLTQDTFIAAAAGIIINGGLSTNSDFWTIDEKKFLKNLRTGY